MMADPLLHAFNFNSLTHTGTLQKKSIHTHRQAREGFGKYVPYDMGLTFSCGRIQKVRPLSTGGNLGRYRTTNP